MRSLACSPARSGLIYVSVSLSFCLYAVRAALTPCLVARAASKPAHLSVRSGRSARAVSTLTRALPLCSVCTNLQGDGCPSWQSVSLFNRFVASNYSPVRRFKSVCTRLITYLDLVRTHSMPHASRPRLAPSYIPNLFSVFPSPAPHARPRPAQIVGQPCVGMHPRCTPSRLGPHPSPMRRHQTCQSLTVQKGKCNVQSAKSIDSGRGRGWYPARNKRARPLAVCV